MQFFRTVAVELLRPDSVHTRSARVVASRTLPHDEEHEEPEVTRMAEAEPANAAPMASLAIQDFISRLVSPGAEPGNRLRSWLKWVKEMCGVEHSTPIELYKVVYQCMEVLTAVQ